MPKLLATLAFAFAIALALHAEAEVVPADLLQKAWQEGTVRVIVRLGAPFAAEGLLRDEVAAKLQRADIADVRTRVLSGLSGTRHRVIHHYETVPFVALELGPDALLCSPT